MRQRTLDHGGGGESEGETAGHSGGGDVTATQLSEQRPRRTGNSCTSRTTKNSSICRIRYKHARYAKLDIWPCMVRYAGFCVTRYARGAGCITPFRAAYDRDDTHEIVPFAETILFKILGTGTSCIVVGKRLYKEDTAWDKGIWSSKAETNPEHIVGTKHGVMGGENDPKTGSDETFRYVISAGICKKLLTLTAA